MTVKRLLASSNYEVKFIGPQVRLETVCALLDQNRIGAVPVLDEGGRLIGIVSERDVVRVVATRGAAGLMLSASEVMTRHVVTMTVDHTVKDVMQSMNGRRIRHLPILEGDRLVAMISIRDVVKYRLQEVEMEKNVLRDYAFAQMR